MASMLNIFSVGQNYTPRRFSTLIASLRRIDASLIEEDAHPL
jgi:hypothetical protein